MTAATYDLDQVGQDIRPAATADAIWRMVWAHGWGQNRNALTLLSEAMPQPGARLFFDFPGFGDSPTPNANWSTADYADFANAMLQANASRLAGRKTAWIGHSFGCRVGLQLAARFPAAIDRMVLISAAGLQRKRRLSENVRYQSRVLTYKALRKFGPTFGLSTEALRKRFGSADYRSAGAMRDIFVNVVNEDLTEIARQVACPVLLIYGSRDGETPPEIGQRLKDLIPQSELVILDGLDHYSVLGDGRHQVAKHIKAFLNA